jgi:S-adenosylhomocysteine hydrolase
LGPQENRQSETEMPGLMVVRAEYRARQPLKGEAIGTEKQPKANIEHWCVPH